MKQKKILLIEEDYNDILAIQNSLKKLDGEHSLHVVHNIRDALQVLMGGSSQGRLENYTQTGKVRPDIVLLNISFLQEKAHEFLDVINKYYSLKNIRVFVIGDSVQSVDPELAARYGIAGYLVKPLDLHNTLNESVVTLRQELAKPGKAVLSLSFLGFHEQFLAFIKFLKVNTASFFAGQAAVAKVAVSAMASVCIAGAITVAPEEVAEAHVRPVQVMTMPASMHLAEAPDEYIGHESPEGSVTLPSIKAELPAPPSQRKRLKTSEASPVPVVEARSFRIVAIEEAEDQQVAAQ